MAEEGPNKIFPSFYIGDINVATNLDMLYEYDISHIVTVAADIKPKWPRKFKYLHINIFDLDTENIKQHFQKTFEFIEKGRSDGAVLVHCVAGVSRSATICIAYILQKLKGSLEDAVGLVKDARPSICPNDGFMAQLKSFEQDIQNSLKPPAEPVPETTSEQQPASSDSTTSSSSTTPSPSTEPEQKETSTAIPPTTRYCCRMCGSTLFNNTEVLPHDVGSGQTSFKDWNKRSKDAHVDCTSYFLLEPTQFGDTSDFEGKLCCPKCNAKFGGWQWAGAQCSCGAWVAPAFQVSKARVDAKPIIK